MLHSRRTHFRSACHHALRGGCRAHVVGALFLAAFEILLVLNLFFDVLVSLENAVVFDFSLLQPFVHSQLETLLVRSHLVCLFLHEFGFRSQNLLVPQVIVLLSLLFLEFVYAALNLMRFLVVLLLG